MTTLRKLTRDDVEIEVVAMQDDIPVRGNAIASGDDEYDTQVENEILERLENGDAWAWAAVEVFVKWGDFYGVDCLGACSYENERDFIQNSGYYEDMVNSALEDLNAKIARTYEDIKPLLPTFMQLEDLLED